MTLTEFLLARIAEDEAIARRMADAVWPGEVAIVPSMDTGEAAPDGPQGCVSVGPQYTPKAYARVWNPAQTDGRVPGGDNFDHGWRYHESAVVTWGPASASRLDAECRARRAMVLEYEFLSNPVRLWDRLLFPTMRTALLPLLQMHAAVYAEHPDYRPEWAPPG